MDAKDLERKVIGMAECYHKGFGNMLVAIGIDSYYYLNDLDSIDRRADLKKRILDHLETIETKYASIPFDNISDMDYAPIFVTRDLLGDFSRDVRGFLEEPTEARFNTLNIKKQTMGYIGETYRDKLNERLSELRKRNGYEKFYVEVIDYNNRTWRM